MFILLIILKLRLFHASVRKLTAILKQERTTIKLACQLVFYMDSGSKFACISMLLRSSRNKHVSDSAHLVHLGYLATQEGGSLLDHGHPLENAAMRPLLTILCFSVHKI